MWYFPASHQATNLALSWKCWLLHLAPFLFIIVSNFHHCMHLITYFLEIASETAPWLSWSLVNIILKIIQKLTTLNMTKSSPNTSLTPQKFALFSTTFKTLGSNLQSGLPVISANTSWNSIHKNQISQLNSKLISMVVILRMQCTAGWQTNKVNVLKPMHLECGPSKYIPFSVMDVQVLHPFMWQSLPYLELS